MSLHKKQCPEGCGQMSIIKKDSWGLSYVECYECYAVHYLTEEDKARIRKMAGPMPKVMNYLMVEE